MLTPNGLTQSQGLCHNLRLIHTVNASVFCIPHVEVNSHRLRQECAGVCIMAMAYVLIRPNNMVFMSGYYLLTQYGTFCGIANCLAKTEMHAELAWKVRVLWFMLSILSRIAQSIDIKSVCWHNFNVSYKEKKTPLGFKKKHFVFFMCMTQKNDSSCYSPVEHELPLNMQQIKDNYSVALLKIDIQSSKREEKKSTRPQG